jgi:hypothetical protein
MEKIYSKIRPEKLLHVIVRGEDFEDGRKDVIEPDEFLQCAVLQLDKGKTFKPHYHFYRGVCHREIPQESWVVLRGKVKCIFYDLDNTIIAEPVLSAGDASFTLQGGHNYEIMEDGTRVLEYKTGPYSGQENDKRFIE